MPDPLGRHGNFGVNLCPSKPAARELLLKNWERLLDEFADPGLDCVTYWPYDEGGCGCRDCWPWGARGCLSLSHAVSSLVREKSPHVKVILSTWTFDTPPSGEWEALSKAAGGGQELGGLRSSRCARGLSPVPIRTWRPWRSPAVEFPGDQHVGPRSLGRLRGQSTARPTPAPWNQTQCKLSGGTPYSEGIYEDINKAVCSQFYWAPERPAIETVREYAAFEFSPDVADDVVKVVEAFEKNHLRGQIGPAPTKHSSAVKRIEAKLTPRARWAWRSRISIFAL